MVTDGIALARVDPITAPATIVVGTATILVADSAVAMLVPRDGGCPIVLQDAYAHDFEQGVWAGRLDGRFVVATDPGGLETGSIVAIDEGSGAIEILEQEHVVLSFAAGTTNMFFQTTDGELMVRTPGGETTVLVADGTQSMDDISVFQFVSAVGDRVVLQHEGRTRIVSWPGAPVAEPLAVFDSQIELDTFLTEFDSALVGDDQVAFTHDGRLELAERGAMVFGTGTDTPELLAEVEQATPLAIRGDTVDYLDGPDSGRRLMRVTVGGEPAMLSDLPVSGAAAVDASHAWAVSDGVLVELDIG